MDEIKKHVLVIENDNIILDVVISELERLGLEAIPARNASAAIEILKKIKPDLIILNMAISGTTGVKLLETIREDLKINAPICALAEKDRDLDKKAYETYHVDMHQHVAAINVEKIIQHYRSEMGIENNTAN